MNRSKLLLAIAFAAGIAASQFHSFISTERLPAASTERNLQITATISESEVQALRESGFDDLRSIEDILQLPSVFARSEATFALAGKSTGSTVQQLIFEAHEIADPVERERILGILFARLAEIDAAAALATARVEPFAGNKSAETSVWRAWARSDLDAAIDAAASETTVPERKRIAQTLFRSVGYTGNAETDLIEARLGVSPDRSTITKYILHLADQSPILAVEHINQTVSPIRQAQYASALGSHLAVNGANEAVPLKEKFVNTQARTTFERSLRMAEAAANPEATLRELLAGGLSFTNQTQVFSALASIVESDLGLALSYYDRMETNQVKHHLGRMIAGQFASEDIDAALEWARRHDPRGNTGLESHVLQVLAQSDPERALDEIRDRVDSMVQFGSASSVLLTIAQSEPQKAIDFLSGLDDAQAKAQLRPMLFGQWMATSPEDALSWVLAQDSEEVREYLANPAFLVQQDVSSAIRLLPQLPESVSGLWRRQIAAQLVNTQSVDSALTFARGYSDRSDYEEMLSDIAQAALRSGPESAVRIAEEMGDSQTRDRTYMRIIQGTAHRNPEQAIAFLERISDDQSRVRATATAAASWYRQDSQRAVQWLSSYPRGEERDQVISAIAGQWADPSASEQRLLDSIADPDVRAGIERKRIFTIARSDPERARAILNSSHFSGEERLVIEQSIEQAAQRRGPPYFN